MPPLRPRPTARVVLLDPENRVLLMRGRLPNEPEGPSFWFTLGGGAEPGETLRAAAQREALEETGLADVQIGPELWYDEVVLESDGEPRLFQQHYFLARTAGGPLSRAGWQQLEHDFVDALRWWTLAELLATSDQLYPENLRELLPSVIAGHIPIAPWVIRTLDGPVQTPPRP